MTLLDHYLFENQPIMAPLFDAIRGGAFILDRQMTIVQVNRWMETAFADRQPLVGKRCHALFRNTPDRCQPCEFELSLRSTAMHVEVLPYPSGGNSERWFEVSMSPIEAADGELVGAIGSVKDISDQVRAEQQLKDEIAWRRLLVDQSRDGIVVLDQDGRVCESNQRFADMLGYSLEEMQRLRVWDWDTQWSEAELLSMIDAADASGNHFETSHRRRDGSCYDVEISTNGLMHRGQKLVFCICRDITARISEKKRIEEALMLTRFSFDKVTIGIFRTAVDGRIHNINRHACRMLGYTQAELCTLSILDIDAMLSTDDREQLWKQLRDQGSVNFETAHRRKDGTTFPVNITANLMVSRGEHFCLSFARDISEEKKRERQRRMLEAHLRQSQKMESLGTLAGSIAHDFNNILSSIYGFVELAQLRCAKNSKLRRYIEEIGMASVRAKDLVQRILTFSRQGQSEKHDLDLSAVVKAAVALVRATFPATIQIMDRIQPDAGVVFADESQIQQVVMNLCTNAYQAMQKDGGLLEIELSTVAIGTHDLSGYPIIAPGWYVKLTVADTGCGMDQSVLEQIFDPYFTTREAGEGTGMGLSAVHGIVQDHGGSIKAYSRPGIGTTVQVFLPLGDGREPVAQDDGGAFAGGCGHILFVDDERLLTEIAKDFLEESGYVVETRVCPNDAMAAFQANPDKFDLVITDLLMPNMSGEQLIEKIRAIRPDLPIIICTGNSANITNASLTHLGVSALLLKPIMLDRLGDAVRKALSGGIA